MNSPTSRTTTRKPATRTVRPRQLCRTRRKVSRRPHLRTQSHSQAIKLTPRRLISPSQAMSNPNFHPRVDTLWPNHPTASLGFMDLPFARRANCTAPIAQLKAIASNARRPHCAIDNLSITAGTAALRMKLTTQLKTRALPLKPRRESLVPSMEKRGKTNCDANEDGTFTCKDEQPCAMPREKTHLWAKAKAEEKKKTMEKTT